MNFTTLTVSFVWRTFCRVLIYSFFFARLTITREPRYSIQFMQTTNYLLQVSRRPLKIIYWLCALLSWLASKQGREIAICRAWFSVAKLCSMETEQIWSCIWIYYLKLLLKIYLLQKQNLMFWLLIFFFTQKWVTQVLCDIFDFIVLLEINNVDIVNCY